MRRRQTGHRVGFGSYGDDGQVSVLVCVAVALFVLLFAGFGVDMTNLFFRRQSAQGAADAACQAGAMDMLVSDQGVPFGGFAAGSPFNCTSSGTQAPCKYAALNGYNSPGLTEGKDSNLVAITFPASVPGVIPPPVALVGNWNFIQVDVTDRVGVYFSSLLSGKRTQDVLARSRCGVITSTGPAPIIVLHPTLTDSFTVGGTPSVTIVGGPARSIQVNSDNTVAAYIGGSASVDLTKAGPNFTGADFGVFGGPLTAPGGFTDGTTGRWLSPATPIQDPLKTVPPPAMPSKAPPPLRGVPYLTNGCPDHSGCDEYFPGLYTSTLRVLNTTAIFDPGVYYIQVPPKTNAFELAANGIARPSLPPATGDGSGGTLFYLSGGSANFGANSGSANGYRTVDSFVTGVGGDGRYVKCPGGEPPNPPLPDTLDGNILLAPCSNNATYNVPPTPQGPNRGILFFQDRSDAGGFGSPIFNGGGGLLLVGTMYFHDCPTSLTGPCGDPAKTTTYQDVVSLVGNSGSATRIIGEIITDQLGLSGTSTINMELNPYVSFQLLKVALLQ